MLKRQTKTLSSNNLGFKRRERKTNISVPLDKHTHELLHKFSKTYKISRTELTRYAIEYSLKNQGFHDVIKQI